MKNYDFVASSRADAVIEDVKEHLARGEKPNMLALQKKHGYSGNSVNSYPVKKTNAWKKFIASVPREDAVGVLIDIMKEGKKDSDRIKAAENVLKVTNSYPARKSAHLNIKSKIDQLRED